MAKPSRAVLLKRCPFGILKNPVRGRSGRIRYCKRNPKITAMRARARARNRK